jgi:ATP-dependent protease Clp ATPase subunit
MLKKKSTSLNHKKQLSAVCFDYRGTLLDHTNDQDIVSGMENLLAGLKNKKIPIALISRFPKEELIKRLGALKKYFENNVYSGGGKAKLDCIKAFARTLSINDFSRIAFIDDKPDNFVPIAKDSDVFVIGFKGSGKYPHAENVCKELGIPFALTARDLENLLFRNRKAQELAVFLKHQFF